MRIAQVCPLFLTVPPADRGGTERVVFDLTEALVRAGHDVTLFAADGSLTSARLIGQGPAISAIEDAPPGLPGAREAVMLDAVAARAGAFDVIHCHTEFAHAAVLRDVRERTLTTVHWRLDQADRNAFFEGFPDLPIAAISKDQGSAYVGANLRGVVHHGLDADRYEAGPGGGGYAAFIGRMTDQKRPDAAIRIARGAGLSCRLAGGVDLGNPRYFRERVEPLLGTDAVFVGPVGDAAKQDFLGGAEALLFPIDWPEPFGLVMIEAMACGTPVIAYRRGSVPEVIEEGVTGFIVETEDEAAAALIRARTLDRAQVRARFEARFTADHMAAGYASIYEGLLS
ncbi:glycosyltransferase family 4 protein [Parvularcula dongshanensis]|uniref:Glycosyltransferase involved in cell wall biosynthesis n=1 Tax=Parvularcula dongshanensis TaxID=1173995 RepID=A0A840I0H7_9PROT|nr:glycosyltransferase family 4 protein [Parvularcula dongshanensis]MBB4657845.1 glycosyltransferase involved in cell wall biosynthesis [Parvularcula dongshanensis]